MSRHIQFAGTSTAEFRKVAELHVEALNHALRDVPSERIRLHLCWGNYEGPHHHDIALADIIDIVLKASPMASRTRRPIRATNTSSRCSRRGETAGGQDSDPEVIDSTTNFIEHPEGVACACATWRAWSDARRDRGHRLRVCDLRGILARGPSIAWAEFRAMSDGAKPASRELWKRRVIALNLRSNLETIIMEATQQ